MKNTTQKNDCLVTQEPYAWVEKYWGSDVGEQYEFHTSNPTNNPNWIPLYTAPRELSDGCGNCHACLVGVFKHEMPVTSQRMIVCPECGNKRCPKASNHRYKCTNSNESNQIGSVYTATKQLSDEEAYSVFESEAMKDGGYDWKAGVRAILKKASEK